jgi:tetratricopeptide (TPR) repeat protein
MLQDWSGAAAEFRRGFPLIDRYPARERMKFRLASARSNVELGDKESAAKDLGDILARKPGPQDLMRAHYISGRLRELNNDNVGALAEYDRAIGGTDRQSKANSRYRKILLQEKVGKITPAAAIEELETLRYTWRGDDLERDILRSLGLFYIKAGDYRAGFETMRQAMSMFSESRQAQDIREDMNRVFSDLFLRGGANSLSPVKALGLYYDFRELTPVGNDGDEMIRRLADRMVSVDLLPQAAELLRHQVDKRLAGTAQAQVAARLAIVYLLDKKPAEALQVLEKTQQIQLPLNLSNERLRIRARALMELGRTVEAMTTLADDKTQDGQYLRADILWSGQRWAEAGAKIEELLNPVKAPDSKIDPMSQSLVLRAAISFALAGDRAALTRMASTFGPRMAKSSDAQSFTALTNSPDISNTDFRELASKIANTATYESFLTAYRSRIRAGGLNAIN